MARKPLLFQKVLPYHVTARSNNQEWFYLPLPEVWKISLQLLELVVEKYQAQLFEFVLMSNHFHLLVGTPNANLDRVMNYFMREFSQTLGPKTGRINHVFGGRYRGCLIGDPLYFAHAYKYVLRNPVEGGLVSRVEDYPFSSYQRERGSLAPQLFAPILFHPLSTFIPPDLSEREEWLNTAYDSEQKELLRRSLRRSHFQFPSHHRNRKLVMSLRNEVENGQK